MVDLRTVKCGVAKTQFASNFEVPELESRPVRGFQKKTSIPISNVVASGHDDYET